MTDDDYLEIRSKLSAVLDQLASMLTESDVRLLKDFVEANELGLALESMVEAVAERAGRIPTGVSDEMTSLATRMEMNAQFHARLAQVTNG